jgi:hypothetical protein
MMDISCKLLAYSLYLILIRLSVCNCSESVSFLRVPSNLLFSRY